MFGIIYWVIGLFSLGKDSFKNELYKEQKRENVANNEFRLYSDRKGRKFWDGEQVFYGYTPDKKRHLVLRKMNGEIVWDFTQHEIDKNEKIKAERLQEKIDDAIKNNMKYYFTWEGKRDHSVELSTHRYYQVYNSFGKYYKSYYSLKGDKVKSIVREETVEITYEEFESLRNLISLGY